MRALHRRRGPARSALVLGAALAAVALAAGSAAAAISAGFFIDTEYEANLGDGFDAPVLDQYVLPDGSVYAVGQFTTADGAPSPRLALIGPDGTVDAAFSAALGVGINNFVRAIDVRPDGSLVIGGQFTQAGGATSNRIAVVSPAGVIDPVYSATTGLGFDNTVNDVVANPDGSVIAAGYFSTFDSATAPRLARLTPDGELDTAFEANLGSGFEGTISSTPDVVDGVIRSVVVQDDGAIVVVGDFATVNGIPAPGIARLDANGVVDTAFATAIGAGFSNRVNSVALLPDGDLAVAGQFVEFNGAQVGRIVVLDPDGLPDPEFGDRLGVGANSGIRVVYPEPAAPGSDAGRLLVGGTFTQFKGVQTFGIARIELDGSIRTVSSTALGGTGATVNTVASQPDGAITVGGAFTLVDGSEARFERLLTGDVDLTDPDDQRTEVGTAAALDLVATAPGSLTVTYSATGLPDGLVLDPATGQIRGTPTTPGVYSVIATAEAGPLSVSSPFTWTVAAVPATPVPVPPAPPVPPGPPPGTVPPAGVPAGTAPGAGSGELAVSGSTSGPLAAIALGLIGAGTAAVGTRRRALVRRRF